MGSFANKERHKLFESEKITQTDPCSLSFSEGIATRIIILLSTARTATTYKGAQAYYYRLNSNTTIMHPGGRPWRHLSFLSNFLTLTFVFILLVIFESYSVSHWNLSLCVFVHSSDLVFRRALPNRRIWNLVTTDNNSFVILFQQILAFLRGIVSVYAIVTPWPCLIRCFTWLYRGFSSLLLPTVDLRCWTGIALFPFLFFVLCFVCRFECQYIPFFVMTLSLPRGISADSSHGCWLHANAIFTSHTGTSIYMYSFTTFNIIKERQTDNYQAESVNILFKWRPSLKATSNALLQLVQE